MLPELPTRQYEWRHQQRRTRAHSTRARPRRVTARRRTARMAEYTTVAVIDLLLVVALAHPAFVRGVVQTVISSALMTITAARH